MVTILKLTKSNNVVENFVPKKKVSFAIVNNNKNSTEFYCCTCLFLVGSFFIFNLSIF